MALSKLFCSSLFLGRNEKSKAGHGEVRTSHWPAEKRWWGLSDRSPGFLFLLCFTFTLLRGGSAIWWLELRNLKPELSTALLRRWSLQKSRAGDCQPVAPQLSISHPEHSWSTHPTLAPHHQPVQRPADVPRCLGVEYHIHHLEGSLGLC